MKIKLDENLSRQLQSSLQDLGHDVSTACDEGLSGRPDTEVMKASRIEGRLVFTLDVGFADVRKFPPGQHPGVFLFRPRTLGYRAVSDFILGFVSSASLDQLTGCVVVVDADRVRIRRPATLADPAG